jgi:hypothetical protein
VSQPRRRDGAVPAVDRAELAWMAGVAGIAAVALVSTLSTHVSLGDAPESVAGVSSVGILHAPGYPVYVAAARLFTWVVPVGSLAWRTNLFSLTCAVLTVVGVFRLARVVGASRAGAAIGAMALALGTSFWFYADFAKHDAFSLLLVVAAMVAIVEWDSGRDLRYLAGGSAVLGLTVGASWQLGALAVPGLLTLVVLGRRRQELVKLLGTAVVAGALTSAAALGYLMVRAGQQPSINWGEATSSSRVVDLLDMRDFSFVNRRLVGLAPRSAERNSSGEGATPLRRLWNYPTLLAREMSVAVLAVAAWGALRWRRRVAPRHAAFLAVTFAVGVLGTAAFVGPANLDGFTTNLVVGGFFGGIFSVVAVWAALGVTDLSSVAAGAVKRRRSSRRSAREDRRRRREGAGRRQPTPSPVTVEALVLGALAVMLLAPSIVVHRAVASHRQPPFADDYATNVFASLPPHAAILTRGGELTFSLLYAQLVKGQRPDVTVVAADSLAASTWYRPQLARRLGVTLPDLPGQGAELAAVAHQLQARGPVYLDMLTTDALRPALGYVARGLVSEVVDGVGPKLPESTADVEQLLGRRYRTDGVYGGGAGRRWPNTFLIGSYVRAHLELARDFNQLGQLDEVAAQVGKALSIDPADKTALGIRKALDDTRAKAALPG